MTNETKRQYNLQALILVARGRIDRAEYTEAAKVFREAADEADRYEAQRTAEVNVRAAAYGTRA